MPHTVGFCALYRFKVQPEKEQAFRASWARLTKAIRDSRGGLGSRLHRGPDGQWFAYAQWPDRETWERSQAQESPDPEASQGMADCVEEFLPAIALEPTDDLLQFFAGE